MSKNATTLTYAINGYQTEFEVASTTGITVGDPISGVGKTYLLMQDEMMEVVAVPVSGHVRVIRGVLGTPTDMHGSSTPVIAGGPNDFATFTPITYANAPQPMPRFAGFSKPLAAAATLVATGPLFHVTGTTATNIITPPYQFVEGSITVIADALWSWVSSDVANGILGTGAVTAANSVVTFTYDASTSRWYPMQATGNIAVSGEVAAATTIVASGRIFHVTGTTATNIITPPSNMSEGPITIIADAAWTWTSSAVANGIAQSGAVTSAGEAVTFYYDKTTALWYADRRA